MMDYEIIEASQGEQNLGTGDGSSLDTIEGLLVIPLTTSPGEVTLIDAGDNSPPVSTSFTVFVGGASSVSNLCPFYIPIGALSANGGWKVKTGANVRVIATGNFS